MIENQRVLLTGGAGFIGSKLAERLADRNTVVILDNGRRDSLSGMQVATHPNVTWIKGDVLDVGTVRGAAEGADYIVHLAAIAGVDSVLRMPVTTMEVNITGTLNLLMACRAAKVRRVVYASSSSCYGDDPALPKVETLPTNPISPYAVSKLAAEHYCRTFARLYGLETVSLRYFNVFGPRQNPESIYSAVIPRFLEQALKREPLEVHGDGLQSRDFTYIDNVVQGNIRAMETPGVSGEVFNIACNKRQTLLDIAEQIGKFLGRTLERKHVASRAGDVKHTLADISKAQSKLGYEPTIDFAEGMRRTCEYFAARFGTAGGPARSRA